MRLRSGPRAALAIDRTRGISNRGSPPKREKRPARAVSPAARQKEESSATCSAKVVAVLLYRQTASGLFLRDAEFLGWGAAGARQVNQCYEPRQL